MAGVTQCHGVCEEETEQVLVMLFMINSRSFKKALFCNRFPVESTKIGFPFESAKIKFAQAHSEGGQRW